MQWGVAGVQEQLRELVGAFLAEVELVMVDEAGLHWVRASDGTERVVGVPGDSKAWLAAFRDVSGSPSWQAPGLA